VSLKQTVHASGGSHVGADLAQRTRLGFREPEGERSVEPGNEHVPWFENYARPSESRLAVGSSMDQLQEEQLLEGESSSAPFDVGEALGSVERLQRLGKGGHA